MRRKCRNQDLLTEMDIFSMSLNDEQVSETNWIWCILSGGVGRGLGTSLVTVLMTAEASASKKEDNFSDDVSNY